MQPAAKRQNLTIVQGLRGIAASWVVLFHANEGGHIPILRRELPDTLGNLLFDAGHYGVAIFFALSGFVISYGIDRSKANVTFFYNFIIRRSIRLDPPYWASIVFCLVLLIFSNIIKHDHVALPSIGSIVSHLFYLQVIMRQPEINTVYWTLTYEVQFYLFLVGIITIRYYFQLHYANSTYKLLDYLLFAFALLSAMGYFEHSHSGLFFPLWASFYVGTLAQLAITSLRAKISFLMLVVVMISRDHFAAVSAFTAIFLLLCMLLGVAAKGMNWRWLQFLGGISYSLYLTHNPVTGAVGFAVNMIGIEGLTGDLIKLAAIICCCIIFAYMFWFAIERTSHNLAKTFNQNLSTRKIQI